jgi:hypothetical protein
VSSARRLPPSFPDLSVAALASLDLDEVDVEGAATAPVEVHRWTDRPALPEVEIDLAGFDDSGQKAPAPRFAVAPPGIASLSHAALVEQLFEDDDERVARAVRELVGRGGAVVDAVAERFPGRLRVDPFDPAHGSPGAAEVGPLVDVLAQLGRAGLDAALPYVESRHPAHRFAAVLLFALSPDVRALDLLRARLHDAEPRIRALAVEAVQPFLAHPRFEGLLFDLRERATSDRLPTAIRRRSVELLGVFRDVGAVPLLVRLLDGPLADTARHSLRTITLVDLGARPRAWEKWWARARKRSRVDWLLDALAADELALRREAHRELAAFAGDDFGYRPDAEKRARARAIEVWRQWWAEEQKHADEPLALTRS